MPRQSFIDVDTWTISHIVRFRAACVAYWAYRTNPTDSSAVRNAVGYHESKMTLVSGLNAPSFLIARDALGVTIGIAGTTTLNQWLAYVLRFGTSPATDIGGFVFRVFDDWSNTIVTSVISAIGMNEPILLCGHSLGGACSILVAEKLLKRRFNVCNTYTFGCPRIGDTTFVNNCRVLHYNTSVRGDPVPHMPPNAAAFGLLAPLPLQALPELLRPGQQYVIPLGTFTNWDAAWFLARQAVEFDIVDVAAAGADFHLMRTYLQSLWSLMDAEDRRRTTNWYGVLRDSLGLALSPAP